MTEDSKPKRKRPSHQTVQVKITEMRAAFFREYIIGAAPRTPLPSVNELALKYQVSFAVARKFLKQMQELGIITSIHRKGYYVHEHAQKNLEATKPETKVIGVVGYLDMNHPNAAFSATAQILNGLENKLHKTEYQVRFFNIYPDFKLSNKLVMELSKAHIDVLIINASNKFGKEDVETLLNLDLPTFTVGESKLAPEIIPVDFNHYDIGAMAVKYLTSLGFQRIAYVELKDKEYWSQQRLAGYRNELNTRGLSDYVYNIETQSIENCLVKIREDAIEAVFCENDEAAALLINAGLNVAQTATMGVDDNLITRQYNLTSIKKDPSVIGEAIAERLIDFFLRKLPLPQQLNLEGTLIRRMSTEFVKVHSIIIS